MKTELEIVKEGYRADVAETLAAIGGKLTGGMLAEQDGESVDVRLDGKSIGRVPLINLEGIVTLGWDIACSPSLLGACAQRGIV
ncbi:MAG: CRISPR-associated endonuclease Cas1 [Opitutales bacterium]|nr:CRISPR-associated endonuclease Cas1 [Opitutales bacterium]